MSKRVLPNTERYTQESVHSLIDAASIKGAKATMNAIRLGIQIMMSLSLLTLAFLLFSTTDISRIYHVKLEQSQQQQQQNAHRGQEMYSPTNRKHFGNISMQASQAIGQDNISPITTGTNQTRNRTRYLIYLCDIKRWCGGWGDRQRGIITSLLLAFVTGRKFGIDMSYPCDIKLFYIPNEIDWYIRTPELRGLSRQVVHWMSRPILVNIKDDFNELFPSDVVFLKTNLDLVNKINGSPRYGHLVPAEYRNGRTAFGIGWHKMMKPTFHLEEHMDKFMSNVPDKGDFVCAHIRFRKNPTIPNDGASLHSLSTVGSLWKFLSRFEKDASRIFIASDSMDVRKSARKHLGRKELDTNGLVLHIDRQGKLNNACLGFEMAVLEQAILTKCKVLVMSGSGFSKRAAMISRTNQTLFTFRNGTIRQGRKIIFKHTMP